MIDHTLSNGTNILIPLGIDKLSHDVILLTTVVVIVASLFTFNWAILITQLKEYRNIAICFILMNIFSVLAALSSLYLPDTDGVLAIIPYAGWYAYLSIVADMFALSSLIITRLGKQICRGEVPTTFQHIMLFSTFVIVDVFMISWQVTSPSAFGISYYSVFGIVAILTMNDVIRDKSLSTVQQIIQAAPFVILSILMIMRLQHTFAHYNDPIHDVSDYDGLTWFYLISITFIDVTLIAQLFQRQLDIMIERSSIDELTKLLTRKVLTEKLNYEQAQFNRYKVPYSIIMIDVDHFKIINDTFGHPVGDKILVGVVDTIKSKLRKFDYFGRWGGEEFMIILPRTSIKDAKTIALKLQKNLEETEISAITQKIIVTGSFGIAEMNEHGNIITIDELISNADTALYHAKHSGRNTVSVFSDHYVETIL